MSARYFQVIIKMAITAWAYGRCLLCRHFYSCYLVIPLMEDKHLRGKGAGGPGAVQMLSLCLLIWSPAPPHLPHWALGAQLSDEEKEIQGD